MARIAGVNIPDNKHTVISLTYIYGVGRTTAQKICAATGINPAAKIKDLSDEQVELLRGEVGVVIPAQGLVERVHGVPGLHPHFRELCVLGRAPGAAAGLPVVEHVEVVRARRVQRDRPVARRLRIGGDPQRRLGRRAP